MILGSERGCGVQDCDGWRLPDAGRHARVGQNEHSTIVRLGTGKIAGWLADCILVDGWALKSLRSALLPRNCEQADADQERRRIALSLIRDAQRPRSLIDYRRRRCLRIAGSGSPKLVAFTTQMQRTNDECEADKEGLRTLAAT